MRGFVIIGDLRQETLLTIHNCSQRMHNPAFCKTERRRRWRIIRVQFRAEYSCTINSASHNNSMEITIMKIIQKRDRNHNHLSVVGYSKEGYSYRRKGGR